PFADPLIFLFIGSFILARGLFLHLLDRRLAFGILALPWIGARPGRILFAVGGVTAFISAWVANTATTAMMAAVALSILAFRLDRRRAVGSDRGRRLGRPLLRAGRAGLGRRRAGGGVPRLHRDGRRPGRAARGGGLAVPAPRGPGGTPDHPGGGRAERLRDHP